MTWLLDEQDIQCLFLQLPYRKLTFDLIRITNFNHLNEIPLKIHFCPEKMKKKKKLLFVFWIMTNLEH